MKHFTFTHYVTQASPLLVEQVLVSASVEIEGNKITDLAVDDIQYRSMPIMELCSIIAPEFVAECKDAALDCAENTLLRQEDDQLDEIRQAI